MKTILIVDDSATLRQLTRAPLEGAGYRLLEAGDGIEALEVLQRETVDLILSDVNMPKMNGLEFVRTLRARARHKDIPVFFVTTESSQAMLDEGKTLGATAWIVKPFKPQVLLKGIEHALKGAP